MNIAILSHSTEDRTSHYEYVPAYDSVAEEVEAEDFEEPHAVTAHLIDNWSYVVESPKLLTLHDVDLIFQYGERAVAAQVKNIGVVGPGGELFKRYAEIFKYLASTPIHALDMATYVPAHEANSRLAGTILALDVDEEAEDAERTRSECAKNDAIYFVEHHCTNLTAAADLSDGVVSLHWRRGEMGLMFIFVGDGRVEYSVHSNVRRFTNNAVSFALDESMPEELTGILAGTILA